MGTSPNHVVGPNEGCPHTHTIIFLHGRGSDPREFAEELFESESETCGPADQPPRTLRALLPTVKWVFPAAPVLPSARFGADMRQWFDMWSVEDHAEEGTEEEEEGGAERPRQRQQQEAEEGLRALGESAAAILRVVRDEARCVAPGRIFLAGISQGFAVALAAFAADDGVRPRLLAGLIGLCGRMPKGLRIQGGGGGDASGAQQEEEGGPLASLESCRDGDGTHAPIVVGSVCPATAAARPTPVLLCHSFDDGVVAVAHGRRLRDVLARSPRDVEVEWHEYDDGGHWINEPRGVDDLVNFLKRYM